MNATEFKTVLLQTDHNISQYRKDHELSWFRAPQAHFTQTMATVLKDVNVTHALGDCYADDWQIRDPELVADLYLKQVSDGSIAIMHMPEHGFREHTLQSMRAFLEGLAVRGLKVVTLGRLTRAAHDPPSSAE